MIPGQVVMCVCFKTTFRDWLKLKQDNGWTLAEAAEHTHCGEGCGTCKLYLRVVSATGITELPILSYEEMLRFPET